MDEEEAPPADDDEEMAAWKAPAAMLLVQLFNTGMVLLSKVAIGGGMFVFALLTYRSLFGASIILPIALLRERGRWKEMDWHAAGWIFLSAFIGYAIPMSLFYYGLHDTTALYATIFMNLIPLATFMLSFVFRMEALRIMSMSGSLKIAGAVVSIGGTMIISLYRGKILHLWSPVPHPHNEEHVDAGSHHQLRGTILLAGSSLMFACWYLIQWKVLKVYPYKYWSSMATCLVGGLQTAVAGVIFRRDKNAWKIGWDINLLTIIYSGALATAAKYSLNSWAVSKKGPSYPPMFMPLGDNIATYWVQGALATAAKYSLNSWAVSKKGPSYPPMFMPLSLVFTVVLGSIFIGDDITVGSLIGTVLVIVGTSIFLWAKADERLEK